MVDVILETGESDTESRWGIESNDDDEEQDRADIEINSNLPQFEQRQMIGRKLMKKYVNQTQLARESVKRTAEIMKFRGDAEEGLETNDAAALEDIARRTLDDHVISLNARKTRWNREVIPDRYNDYEDSTKPRAQSESEEWHNPWQQAYPAG